MTIHHNKEAYQKQVAKNAKKSPTWRDCFRAFWVGGVICTIGQLFFFLYRSLGVEEAFCGTLVTVTLIFLASTLTGLGIFDKLARYAGGGTLLPVTGFANAVVSPAIDSKSEGLILGVGGKIFTIAGPVLLFGTLAGGIYGVIYYVVSRIITLF